MSPEARIALSSPILVHGEQVTELVLKSPQVRHLRAMDEARGDIARAAALIAELAAIPPSAVDTMSAADFTACSAALAGFFGGSLPTGGT